VSGAEDGAGGEARCPEGGGVAATRGASDGAVGGANMKISRERVANPVAIAMAP